MSGSKARGHILISDIRCPNKIDEKTDRNKIPIGNRFAGMFRTGGANVKNR